MRRFSYLAGLLLLAALGLPHNEAYAQAACPISSQTPQIKTGTTYTVAASDQCSLLDFTSGSAIAVTLPNANTLPAGFTVTIKAGGAGAVTITPTTSTVDGNTSLLLGSGASGLVWGNNVNYFSSLGGAGNAFQSGSNIIENGDFLVDQPNAGASATFQTSLSRLTDRWYGIYTVSSSGGSAPTGAQAATSTGLTLTGKEYKVTASSSASTSTTAGMITYAQQTVEASDMQDLQWGNAGGTPVTVSLYMKSSIAGANIGVALKGASSVQSYVNNCVLSGTASTWTFCSFTIPAPTTGTWTQALGSAGPVFTIALQCGSTFQTTAGSWQTGGPFYCTSAQTQQLATASSTLEYTAIKMERGTTPTAYVTPALPTALNVLRRYYDMTFPLGTAPAQNAGIAGVIEGVSGTATANTLGLNWRFHTTMYAAPTVTTYNPAAANANCRDITTTATALTASVDPDTAKSTDNVFIACTGTPAAADHFGVHAVADSGI